jgi:hypothetical protein
MGLIAQLITADLGVLRMCREARQRLADRRPAALHDGAG